MKQILILLTIAFTGTFAIPPQVRGPPATGNVFDGAQNVPRVPAVPLTHPLPATTRDGRYTSSVSGSSNSNSGNYGGSVASSSSSNSNYNNNQGQYESTNRVSSYVPSSAPAAPSRNNYVKSQGPSGSDITIVRSEFNDNYDGSYTYAFENSDGTKTEQRGYVKNAGTDNEIFVQEGSYQYYGPDGVVYTVTYISDENGYQPTGTHLPTIPNPVRSSNNDYNVGSSSSYGPTTARPNYFSGNNNNANRNRY